MKSHINIKVYDKNRKLKRSLTQPFNTYVKNFLLVLRGMFRRTGESVTTITGGSATYSSFPFINGGALGDNRATQGIRIGTSNTAYDVNQNALGSILTHNTTWGLSIVTSILSNREVSHFREFTNLSGSSVTINEIGVQGGLSSTSMASILLARDLITPISLGNLETILVEYKYAFEDSFTDVFAKFFHGMGSGGSSFRWEGSSVNILNYSLMWNRANSEGAGIVLGTGNSIPFSPLITANAAGVSRLENIITYGSGSGQLIYGDCVVDEVELFEGVAYMDIRRPVFNLSSGDITVREVALRGNSSIISTMISTSGIESVMWYRKILDTPVTIPAGEGITIRVRISHTY